MNRHLKLSDGEDHFGGELKDPPEWEERRFIPSTTKKSSTKKKTENKSVKSEPKPSSGPMMFDESKGRLVPFMDLT